MSAEPATILSRTGVAALAVPTLTNGGADTTGRLLASAGPDVFQRPDVTGADLVEVADGLLRLPS